MRPDTFIFLVFFLIIILVVLYYVIIRRIRSDTILLIHKNSDAFRKIQKSIRSIQGRYKFFEPYQQGPFTVYIVKLRKILISLTSQYLIASRLRRDILFSLPQRLDSQIKEFFHFMRRGQSDWSRVRSRENNLGNQLEHLNVDIEKALTTIREIGKLPDKTAAWAVKIKQRVNEIKVSLDDMTDDKVWGKILDDGKTSLKIVLAEIHKIPGDFYNSHHHISVDLLNTTITVNQILDRVEIVSEKLYQDVNNWKKQLSDCSEAVKKARVKYTELEKAIPLIPVSLDITPERKRFKDFSIQLVTVENDWVKPRLENVPSMTLEANRITQEITSLLATLKRYEDLYEKFSNLHRNLYSRIQILQGGFGSQVGLLKYPLRWDLSQQKADALVQVWGLIEPISNFRTPEKVKSDYEQLLDLDRRLKELEKVYEAIVKQAKELREYWDGERRVLKDEWLQKNHELDQKVIIFSPENWETKLQVGSIKSDALKLIQRAEQILPIEEATTIFESKLKERLDLARNLLTDIESFEYRQKNIESKYTEILKIEVEANEKIKTTLPWVRTIVKEIDSWHLPTNKVKDLHVLFNQGDELKTSLSQRNIGKVSSKLQNVNAWVKDVNNKVTAFSSRLTDELNRGEDEVKRILSKLDEICSIKDDEVFTARQLVAMPLFAFSTSQVSLNLDQTHQKIKAILSQLDKVDKCKEGLYKVALPVIDIAEDTRECLRKAYELLDKAEFNLNRPWPPVASEAIPEYERESLKSMEEDIYYFKNRNQSSSNIYDLYVNIRDKARETILDIQEKIRIDAHHQAHYRYLEGNIKSRLRTRIREQVFLIPGTDISPEMYQHLEISGMKIVEGIKQDYLDKKIDYIGVEEILQQIFQPYNTKINLQDFSIHTNGGPAFAGAVYNSGSISGRSDNYFSS